ncbi:MAG: M23 family metallopeptidase [Candidatus Woesearchaeota archaeon]|nr:M23 family metallopeptidase [Candidatus Woesearchaeota archaeon]
MTKRIRITSDESPAHTGTLKHSVDFICAEGTPVCAAADGKVIEIKSDGILGGKTQDFEKHGNYVEIEHANEEYSEYEHLKPEGIVVVVGQFVRKGELIGFTGVTGWLAHLGPHLHFMVGKYGKTVKDYQTLKIKWEKKQS